MTRKFNCSEKLVIASHNQGKVREIRALLEPLNIEIIGASELGLEEPEETGQTFIENAELKASIAAKRSNHPALSDDSGFAVAALGGAPGIYSARWAGADKNFGHAMERVSAALLASGSSNRVSEFICALTLAWPDGHCESFEGRISGEVVWPPRGDRGFGYDPIFTPLGHSQTFGEMDPAEKHAMSHRAIAFNQLLEACFTP
jgi:XTP/dITP diphosphohydrolase